MIDINVSYNVSHLTGKADVWHILLIFYKYNTMNLNNLFLIKTDDIVSSPHLKHNTTHPCATFLSRHTFVKRCFHCNCISSDIYKPQHIHHTSISCPLCCVRLSGCPGEKCKFPGQSRLNYLCCVVVWLQDRLSVSITWAVFSEADRFEVKVVFVEVVLWGDQSSRYCSSTPDIGLWDLCHDTYCTMFVLCVICMSMAILFCLILNDFNCIVIPEG